MTALHVCRYCDGLITDEAPGKPVAFEPGMSGPGYEVWAHNEHAHLVKPDPRPLLLLDRIHAHRAGQPGT
ncbi:hypothetical protein ACQEVY_26350 [Streptomyces sp. CA-288835]|uniref:hypothetical protein n=1 Tax=Streptomyces sp. CA-288835 TaxID=3240069 RepID=UPI003D8D87C7